MTSIEAPLSVAHGNTGQQVDLVEHDDIDACSTVYADELVCECFDQDRSEIIIEDDKIFCADCQRRRI